MFDVPFKVEPRWKWWMVRMLGRPVHREGGITFRRFRGRLWIF